MADRSRSPDNANFFLSWFKWIAGAAFPANPFLYRPFFRTDLGWLCYWDGTRWLTVQEYVINSDFDHRSFAATALDTWVAVFRDAYAPYITRLALRTIVLTTNDATNNWTILIQGVDMSFTNRTTIHQFDTSGDTAGTAANHGTSSPSGGATPANNYYVNLRVTKNNAPGTLIFDWNLAYRLIVT